MPKLVSSKKINILVVEDDGIVAKDLQTSLQNYGYDVPVILTSGEDVLEYVKKNRPNLVIMDVMLKGHLDGIAVANDLRFSLNIPVVYLTAYADNNILERAKLTEPFGYILKPFEELELKTIIEMTLYRVKIEAKLKESEERYRSFVQNFQGIAFHGDLNFKPFFFHGAVEEITGYSEEEFTKGGLCWDKIIHPEDLPLLSESLKKISFSPEYSTQREYRIIRKDKKIASSAICDQNSTGKNNC
ncbi:MAG: response regulator [bacterium]